MKSGRAKIEIIRLKQKIPEMLDKNENMQLSSHPNPGEF
jgi:hypothetical protein